MVNLKIKIPDTFLKEEVRCDYKITREMKELWAIELDLYMELKRVCNKFNLKFAADSGTLLGAIRHNGFIPWDDDMDFSMPREDYEKLCEIAPKEFAPPYYFENFYTDPHFVYGAAKLMNNNTTGVVNPFTKHHGIFIDIFPMDDRTDNKKEALQQRKEAKKLFAQYQRIVTCSNKNYYKERKISLLRRCVRFLLYYKMKILHIKVGDSYHKKLFKRFEDVCKRFNNQGFKYMGAIGIASKGMVLKEDFNCLYEIDFEFKKIPVYKHYDIYLTSVFGDWHKMVRGGSLHTFIVLDTSRPYIEVLKERGIIL